MIQISERLKKIARFLPKNGTVADIGSDHAYLPIYALFEGIVQYAISGEVAEGPYQSALSNVRKYHLQEKISVRMGDGLAVIEPEDQVDCIVIAGMGGALIEKILHTGQNRLEGVQRLVLQPNGNAHLVRNWLYENGWQIIQETIMEEDGHIYEIIVAEKGHMIIPNEVKEKQLFFGPLLLKENSPILQKKWAMEKRGWMKILNDLQKAKETEETKRKKRQLETYVQWYEEVFNNEKSERT
ncbi:tRNA (adenine(22)-N(1))-methyltransferase [Fervidibacillus albus]|uniref:tRNA (Adenine(22)-N(1))-methyltransferase TrmK n=1 Tax=Fervidibacillus albus TaxID=2980026 RepID=A0A9E8RWK3_9BACI|nr:class I SAM-dependent methyltransferase [Fervidibacillus albus]WAA10394.1 tRNA (adenine(22)-N(1))-methyltransferase TrmK [Fervidibacillus albus]